MKYTSTRDGSISCSFEEALCSGYAPDGGLFVPEKLPGDDPKNNNNCMFLSNEMLLQEWAKKSYPDLTFSLLRLFISPIEVPDEDLMQICKSSLHGFTNPDHAVPVVKVGTASLYIAELFHGPTFCFKDLGMRTVIHLLSYFSTKRRRQTILLVATTGDTGPAAVQAVSDVNNPLLSIVVHYPHDQISDFQRKSLTTVNNSSSRRVRVVAFEGGGDDMDLPIKNILASHSQKYQEANNNNNNNADATTPSEQHNDVLLTGVNSYNIGRPLMQMVHFVWTYLRVIEQLGYVHEAAPAGSCEQQQQQQQKSRTTSFLPVVDIVLPTGAMGNLAGGYMAKKMGLPLGKLNAGVNINDITHRVLQTGEFHRNPIMHKTLSEAINIQVPYNFERLLFYLTNGNHDLVRAWMMEMNDNDQKLNLNNNNRRDGSNCDWLACLQRDFNSACVTDDEMCATMRTYLESYNYLVDPNTAVALCAAQKLGYTTACTTTTTTTDVAGNETALSSPPVVAAVAILSTASPCKFQEAVTTAIGTDQWSYYVQNGFPQAAKRIQELPEIPPIMYHRDDDCSLVDCQIKWEQQTRDIIAELIKGHQTTLLRHDERSI